MNAPALALQQVDPFFRDLPETHAFLRAAAASPADDTPRLVLADWLEEHDFRDRAEFIRLQCGVGPGGNAGVARQDELRLANQTNWVGAYPEELFRILAIRPDLLSCWQRGLYERATSPYIGAFVRHAAQLFAETSFRQIDLREGRRDGAPLQLRWLEELVECPELERLTMLGLAERNIGPSGAALLAQTPGLTNLLELDLDENALRNDGVAVLARAPHLAHLRCLRLGGNAIGDDGLCAFLTLASCPHLEKLDLGNRAYRSIYGWSLRGLPPNIRGEDQHAYQISDRGIETLVNSPMLDNLKALRLSGNRISNAGLALLAAAPRVQRLQRLDLSSLPVGDGGIRAIIESPHLTQLRWLDLPRDINLSGPTYAALTESRFFHAGLARFAWSRTNRTLIPPETLPF